MMNDWLVSLSLCLCGVLTVIKCRLLESQNFKFDVNMNNVCVLYLDTACLPRGCIVLWGINIDLQG